MEKRGGAVCLSLRSLSLVCRIFAGENWDLKPGPANALDGPDIAFSESIGSSVKIGETPFKDGFKKGGKSWKSQSRRSKGSKF